MAKSIANETTLEGHGISAAADHLGRTALKLFARKGYASTSVNEIVEAAGVTKPMLYYYFGSKERLARRLVIEPAERLIESLEAIERSDSPLIDQQVGWMRAQLEFCRENPDRARFVFALYFGPLGADLADAVGRIGERAKAILRKIVTKREELADWNECRVDDYVRAIQGQMLSTIIDMLYTEDVSPLLTAPIDDLARRLIIDLDSGYLARDSRNSHSTS